MEIFADLPDGTFLVDEGGEVRSAQRLWKFDHVPGNSYGSVAYEILNHPAVPKVRDRLCDEIPQLRLLRRVPRVVGLHGDGTKIVNLELYYEAIPLVLVMAGDPPEAYPSGPVHIGGGAALNQETTSLDRDGQPIVASYTKDGQTSEQVVPITVPQIAVFAQRQILIATNDPEAVAGYWADAVNEVAWKQYAFKGMGGAPALADCPAECWLCTHVSSTPVDVTVSPNVHWFKFEFAFKEPKTISQGGVDVLIGGYVYSAAYTDPATGREPEDIDWDNGRTLVHWHKMRNFGLLFAN